jgi:hypothetical protein
LFGVVVLALAILILMAIPFVLGKIQDSHNEYLRAKYRARKISHEKYGTFVPSMNPCINFIRQLKPYKNTPDFERMKRRFNDEWTFDVGPSPANTHRLF